VLTSVHSFASDPTRGVFILAILVAFIGGSLALFAARAPMLRQGGIFAPVSREGALVLNNLLLATACATVFVGTLYPLALEAVTGDKISVGAPFFNLTFLPLIAPLLLLVPFGRRSLEAGRPACDRAAPHGRVRACACARPGPGGREFRGPGAGAHRDRPWRIPGARVRQRDRDAVVAQGPGFRLDARQGGRPAALDLGHGPRPFGRRAYRHRYRRGCLGPGGVGALKPGEQLSAGPYSVRLESVVPRTGPNYREDVARLSVARAGVPIGHLDTAKRLYVTRGTSTTEAGIMTVGAFGKSTRASVTCSPTAPLGCGSITSRSSC
jgi:cytochrome c-type biogenesis protein CcmF